MKKKHELSIAMGETNLRVKITVTQYDGRYSAHAKIPFCDIDGFSGYMFIEEDDAIFCALNDLADNMKFRILSTPSKIYTYNNK